MPEFDFYETEDKLEELVTKFYEAQEDIRTAGETLIDLSIELNELRLLAEEIAHDFTMIEGILDNPETEFDMES